MATLHLVAFTGVDSTTTGGQSEAIPLISGVAGDVLLSATVVTPSPSLPLTGPNQMGVDVTSLFNSTVQVIPGIVFGSPSQPGAAPTPINFHGPFILQANGANLAGAVILALLQRS